jgi:hypothetical protein
VPNISLSTLFAAPSIGVCLEATDQISHFYRSNKTVMLFIIDLYVFRQQTRIQVFERKPSKNINLKQLNQDCSDGQRMQYARGKLTL